MTDGERKMTWGIEKKYEDRDDYLKRERPAHAALKEIRELVPMPPTGNSPDDGVLDFGNVRIVARYPEDLTPTENTQPAYEKKWFIVGAPDPDPLSYELDVTKPVEKISLVELRRRVGLSDPA